MGEGCKRECERLLIPRAHLRFVSLSLSLSHTHTHTPSILLLMPSVAFNAPAFVEVQTVKKISKLIFLFSPDWEISTRIQIFEFFQRKIEKDAKAYWFSVKVSVNCYYGALKSAILFKFVQDLIAPRYEHGVKEQIFALFFCSACVWFLDLQILWQFINVGQDFKNGAKTSNRSSGFTILYA